MSDTSLSSLKEAYRRTAIIGAAMVLSLVGYIAVAVVIRTVASPFRGLAPGVDRTLLRNVLLAVAIAGLGLVPLLRGRLLHDSATTGVPGSAKAADLIAALTTSSIVGLALAESIAILGLVLFLLAGQQGDFVLFLGLSLIGFILFFPRYQRWEELAKKRGLAS